MVIDVPEQGSGAVKPGKAVRETQSAVQKSEKPLAMETLRFTRTGTGIALTREYWYKELVPAARGGGVYFICIYFRNKVAGRSIHAMRSRSPHAQDRNISLQ